MLIRYYDHALFTLETLDGTLIAFDPYDASVGYPLPVLAPDIVLMSHDHRDHGNRALFPNAKTYLTAPGAYRLGDIRITGVAAFHDDEGGQKRGRNTLFRVEADGLNIVHLGDLGHMLSKEQLKALGRVDILFVPMGGHYTIDATAALKVMEDIAARVTIPMHFKTKVNAAWPIGALDTFTRFFDTIPEPMPIVRVMKEDIMCLPPVIVMKRM